MNVRHFLVSRAARLFRVGAHVECVPESAPIPTAAPAAAGAAAAIPAAAAQQQQTEAATEAAAAPAAAENQQQQQQEAAALTTDFLLSIRCSRDGETAAAAAAGTQRGDSLRRFVASVVLALLLGALYSSSFLWGCDLQASTW